MYRNVIVIVFALLSFGSQHAPAQCGEFTSFLHEGDGFFRVGEYSRAIKKYQSAMTDCPELVFNVQERIQMVVTTLKQLKEQIDSNVTEYAIISDTANARLCRIESLRIVLEAKIDSLNEAIDMVGGLGEIINGTVEEITDIINQHVLTGRSITLARRLVGRRFEYFYIDVNGEEIKKLKTWTYATQFGSDSLAIVCDRNDQYILKTSGKKQKMSKGMPKSGDGAVDLTDQNRKSLPERIYLMSELEILKANRNEIVNIPRRIGTAGKLQELYLADNRLRHFRAIVHLRGLRTLDLSANRINEIPRKISKLSQLQLLDLSDNKIWVIPKEFYQIRQLEQLDLSYNHISVLGSEIGGMKNLQKLDLSFNNLVAIPHSLTGLKNLRILGLTGNRIQWLDEYRFSIYLRELTGLKELHIGKNPCSDTEEQRKGIVKYVSEWLPNCTVLFN